VNILYVPFQSAEEFLSRIDLDDDATRGFILVPTKARYETGETVVLEIHFPGLPNRILARANFRKAKAQSAVFEFQAGEEHKRDFLVAVASGKALASWQRKNRRFPLRLPARFVIEGEEQGAQPLRGDAETEDVNSRGVFLKTARSLPEGARVTIILDPCDGSAEMEFTGRVVYSRRDNPSDGIGVQFDKLNSDDTKRLRRMIRDVKLSGKASEWEDATAG
jgi:Tfp pilus assembly protein PilZ